MFQTIVQIQEASVKIGYQHKVITLGSCFAENIGKKLTYACFNTDINPFGVLYNPISIGNSIDLLLQNNEFTAADIFEYKSLWQSFAHSSFFSDIDSEGCLKKINSRLQYASSFLQQANFLLITFGTAWIFEEKKSAKVVSNCHKLPSGEFIRRRLTVDEIVTVYTALIEKLQSHSPTIELIFSVSPIRHWKDGAHENNISKSTLLLAIDILQQRFPQVHYFPAYEIQMDELRDYRFYASDMIHPSDVAVDYIWKRFSETFFDKETLYIKTEIEQLIRDLAHRPLHPKSPEFQKFQQNTQLRKAKLMTNYPFLKLPI